MEVIRTELGGSWKVFLLSIPLDVITFLFLVIVSGSVVWQYLGDQWGKSPALLLVVPGLLFALYYIFFRGFFLENLLAALIYFVALSSVTILLPVIPVLIALVVFIVLLGAAVYLPFKIPSRVHEPISALNEPIEIPVDDIYKNINGVYVQQFLANTKSTFEAYRALYRAGEVQGIPAMISAYPRRLLKKQLKESDVEAAIESTIRETGLDSKKVNRYIKRELKAFLDTQRETTVYGYEKVNLRAIASEMEQNHPKVFYQYAPLHYQDLKRISEAEGLDVITLKDLEVLAGLITYTNKEGQQKYAILMRDDDSEHQALKEFAMAHELGHWCAHIKGKPEELGKLEFYLNSLHDLGQFEAEANKIALITLFPTAYLALCEVKKTLTAESIFADYIEGMRDIEKRDPEGQLKTNMMGFLEMRIGNYQKYRHTWLQRMELLDRPLPRQFVRPLASYIGEDFAWAELDDNYIVIGANEKFAALVGRTKEHLLQMKIDVRELSERESRHITSEQLKAKREDLIPKFYVTRYENLQTQEITPVTIYALPIVEGVKNDEYTGSFGIVTVVHRKAEVSH